VTASDVGLEHAERALRDEEERRRILADSVPDLLWSATVDGFAVDHNRRWLRYTGQTPEEARGTGWLEPIHPDDREAVRHWWRTHGATARSFRAEFRLRRAEDGQYRWHQARAEPMLDGRGRILLWFGSCTDVHELSLAREALREREVRLRLALEFSKLGDWSWDAATDIVTCSQRAAAIMGIHPGSQMTWRQMRTLLHKEDRDAAREEVERAVLQDADYDVEYRVNRPDGSVAWVALKGRARYGSLGEPLGMIGVIQDISERKAAERSIRDSEARYRALFEQAAVGVMHADLHGRWTLVNRRLAEILGYDYPEALIGRTYHEMTHPDDRPEGEALVKALDAGQIPYVQREKRYLRKDGSFVWVNVTVSVVRDPTSGAPRHRVAVVQDIAEQRRAQERQTLLIKELNHRVKNTLAAVQAIMAQGMRGAGVCAEVREGIEARLIALSRSHDLLTRERWQSASLADLVGVALDPYRSAADQPPRYRLQGPEVRLPPNPVLALGMAFHELATNAAKYGALSNEVGHVEVAWSLVSKAAEVRLKLCWRECGGPPVSPPRRTGFGSRLLERGLAHELECTVRLDYAPAGLVCEIEIPVGEASSTA
jgi:PAS domain S-box-containing protein